MWRVYRDDDPSRPVEPNENATPGMAPPPALGLDSIELLVDGECFVVSRRPASLGTYDFRWISHPESYGFATGGDPAWRPDQDELTEDIGAFLAQVDPETGYLPD